MPFLFVLHFVYIWGWNKSKPEFLYLAQFLWHFLKVSISSRGELWRGKSCKGWVTTGARRSLLRSFSFSRNAKIVAGLSTRPLTAESFGQRLAESISWEGGVMQELMQAGRRSTGRSHLDTPDHLSADHSNLHPSLSVALWNEVKFNYIDIVAMQSLALICVKLLQRSNLKPPTRAWKSQLLLFLAPL